ncbi:hypothetical protein [Rugosimonospora africana]|uniref:Uncharacterized protein n=1 Tax=Rugosimonospora africana TaxID=556532 RepID=A0A8J3QLW0_9ACTN|nr:hypothetical protein [Rugosimonospora africana]GIH12259.1 hypothetical protein Raf01_04310 [Rugosimonospora africana]
MKQRPALTNLIYIGGFYVSLSDADVAADLAPAGLHFVARDRAAIRIPVEAANLAPCCRDEDGRIDGPSVDLDDSDRAGKINAQWFRLATGSGLFDEHREFLLEVDYSEAPDEPELAWVRVQLSDEWDIAGSGASALGSYGVPEFSALSIDERVLMRTTRWGNGTVSSLVVPSPVKVSTIRNYVEWMTNSSFYPFAVQEAARVWLTTR